MSLTLSLHDAAGTVVSEQPLTDLPGLYVAAAGLTFFVVDALGETPLFAMGEGGQWKDAFLRYVAEDRDLHLARFAAQIEAVNRGWEIARERSPELPPFPVQSADRVNPEVQVFLARSVLGGRVDAAGAEALGGPLAWVRALISTAVDAAGDHPDLLALLGSAAEVFRKLDEVRAQAVAIGGSYEAG